MEALRETAGRRPWTSAVVRWWAVVVLWFASCVGATALWDGLRAKDRTFEQLLVDTKGTVNVEAAIGRLREKLLTGVRAIKAHRERPDRVGSLARNALAHVDKEIDK